TDSLADYLVTTFESQGISRDRLDLVHRRPRSQYLDLIQQSDIALDPFPFNGHTTTCDALWQGVPVVTLSGEHYVSRFGGSGLATLGLDELIATTPAQYVDIAAALAENVDRRRQLRSNLRAMMTASPLLDSAAFTARLEAAYRQMWSDWCSR
ncbi:MAG TPA: hypothetical protein VHV08_06640, partial [Pirellulales bacterium]|nr:hypothetical protein [Pirellulales bacterium]